MIISSRSRTSLTSLAIMSHLLRFLTTGRGRTRVALNGRNLHPLTFATTPHIKNSENKWVPFANFYDLYIHHFVNRHGAEAFLWGGEWDFRPYDMFWNTERIIDCLEWGCNKRERFLVSWSPLFGKPDEKYHRIPTAIMAIQGHTGKIPDALSCYRVLVTHLECPYVLHTCEIHPVASIARYGLYPGGMKGDRCEVYLSTTRQDHEGEDVLRTNSQGDLVTIRKYAHDGPITVAIDVKAAEAEGCTFVQTH